MPLFDIIILIVFIPAIYYGIKDGFVRQLGSLVALILGAYLAYTFSALLGSILSNWINADAQIVRIISFATIFIVVVIFINMIAKLLEKIIKVTMLSWVNKLLGVAFSILKTAIILSVVIVIIEAVDSVIHFIPDKEVAESRLYGPLSRLAGVIFPTLKSFLGI